MKKIIKYFSILLTVLICNIYISDVYAATAKISVSSATKQVVVGNTFKVNITVSASEAIGSWAFDLNYDSSKLSFVSSNLEGSTSSKGVTTSSNLKSKTYTVTFKAKKSGTATVGVKNVDMYTYSEKLVKPTTNTISVKMLTQQELESSYSSVNTLSSLSISGYAISPKFDKNTNTYSVTVPNNVSSVTINAKATDSKARISGTGKRNVSEGINKLNVIVTAENGNKRTYVINVTVKELNPIKVIIDGSEYNVVRKSDKLVAPTNYKETKVTIDGEDVPAFENEITGYKLVGLTNSKGETNLYVYDNGTYTLYNEHKFSGVTLYVQEIPKEDKLNGIKKTTATLGTDIITAYTLKDLDYKLVYGMNIETGKTGWYTYDEVEGTLQKYMDSNTKDKPTINYEEEHKPQEKSDDKYKTLSIILGVISGILFVVLIGMTIKLSKQKKTGI